MMSLPVLLPDPMILLGRKVSVQEGPQRKSGRCASYWNAFLLGIDYYTVANWATDFRINSRNGFPEVIFKRKWTSHKRNHSAARGR